MFRIVCCPFVIVCLLALAITPGCGGGADGGGGGGGGESSGPHTDLTPVTSVSEADIIHFLNRTHFGFNPADLATVQAQGYTAYVDWMLSMPTQTSVINAATSAEISDMNYPGLTELLRWWVYIMNRTANPFQEVLAMFWHDHFATSVDAIDLTATHWVWDHIDLWRSHTTGNFGDILYRMATDQLMLVWLNGVDSTVTAPNENFAREFWELFSLGADNGYTQQDIEQAARSFTGYRSVFWNDAFGSGFHSRRVVWENNRHDNGTKTILGRTVTGNGQQEYRDIVDLTLDARGMHVARFICRKLWEYFVYRNPGSIVINDLAQGFVASGFDLKALYRRILLSKAFFSAKAREPLIKNVLEHHVGYMRATGLFINSQRIDFSLRRCGQEPTRPPTVNGWPKHTGWLSSQQMLERANFLRDCNVYYTDPPQSGWSAGALLPPGVTTDQQVVDYLARLMQVQLTPDQRADAITYINSDRNSGGVISQPWDVNNATQRDKKIRGLLYIYGLHATYQLK